MSENKEMKVCPHKHQFHYVEMAFKGLNLHTPVSMRFFGGIYIFKIQRIEFFRGHLSATVLIANTLMLEVSVRCILECYISTTQNIFYCKLVSDFIPSSVQNG